MTRRTLSTYVWVAVLATGLSAAWAAGTAGTIDTTYGTGGVADATIFNFTDAVALADGSVLAVGGRWETGGAVHAVQKFTPAGALDTTFGPNNDGIAPIFGGPEYEYAHDLELGPDGRIYVAGYRSYATGNGKKKKSVRTGTVACLTSGGVLDVSFGGGGYRDTGGGQVWEVHVVGPASGYDLILCYAETVTVSSGGGGRGKKGGGSSTSSRAVVLHRLDDTGADVTSWGTEGKVVDDIDPTMDDLLRTVEIDASGRIVAVVAQYADGSPPDEVLLTRYGSDGSLDTSFGSAGRLSIDALGIVSDIAIHSDGQRIAVAAHNGASDPQVVLYNAAGSAVDVTFDVPSIPDTVNPSELDTWTRNIEIDASGRLYVCMWHGLTNCDFSVVRCLANGNRDTGFGPTADGISEFADYANCDDPRAMVIDGSGRIVVVGQAPDSDPNTNSPDGILVRWHGN